MPKLWNATIEAHRRDVHAAILDAAALLVEERGQRALTMSAVAAQAGIGRATLYKYFADVEAILVAWHERQIAGHLAHLAAIRDRAGEADQRLRAVLEAYAAIVHSRAHHHDAELVTLLHHDQQLAPARRKLHELVRPLVVEGAATGDLRDDVAPDELVSYCLHALTAAGSARSKAAVARLVGVTLDALRPRGRPGDRAPTRGSR